MDDQSTNIKHLAHSLLSKEQNASRHNEVKAPKAAPKLKLPHHILQHAHEYIGKIIAEKRKINPQ